MIHTPSIAGVTVYQRWCLAGMRGIPTSWYRYLPADMTQRDRRQ